MVGVVTVTVIAVVATTIITHVQNVSGLLRVWFLFDISDFVVV